MATRLQLDVRNCQLNLGIYLAGRCVHLTEHRGGRWLAAVTDIDGPTKKFEISADEAERLRAVSYKYDYGDADSVSACMRELVRMGYDVPGGVDEYDDCDEYA